MSKIVNIELRDVYGRTLAYPVTGCLNASRFAELVGRKTFSLRDLVLIESLGFTIDGGRRDWREDMGEVARRPGDAAAVEMRGGELRTPRCTRKPASTTAPAS